MSAARAVGEPRRRTRLAAVAAAGAVSAAGEADQAIGELYRAHYRQLVRIAALLAGQPGQPREAGPADHARSGQVRVSGETGPARQAAAGRAEQAEQIVQDAFVGLHAAWCQVGDRRAALAYLRRSVLAGTRAAARPVVPFRPAAGQPGGKPAPGTEPAPGSKSAPGPEPAPGREAGDNAARAGARQDALLAAIGALPGGQREALILALYAGLPMPDIAAAMDVSPDAAAWHLTAAKTALRGIAAG